MEKNEVMPLKMAKETIEKWLDAKRVSERIRNSNEGVIENLVEAVQYGWLILDEDNEMTLIQKLVWPLGTNEDTTQLSYKLRITSRDIEPFKKIVKGDSIDDHLTRAILALTDKSPNIVRGLDKTTDRALADSIAIFFV